jgi:predicted outer membrane protein
MTAVLAVATGLVMAALTWSAIPSTAPKVVSTVATDDGWSDSATGPVGPADRDMLVAVRQAGLWQAPVAQQAGQMAGDGQVREVAAAIATAHDGLAAQVRSTAGDLGVVLPSLPTVQQQSWLAELSGEKGSSYDSALVNRLYGADAAMRAQVDKVRTTTQNTQVRDVAAQAVDVLDRQARDLESTGLVDPTATAPPADTDDSGFPLGLVAVVAVVCVVGLVRTARTPRRHRNLILAPLNPRREF